MKISPKSSFSHSNTLAWRIPWTQEPGGLQSMGSLRVGHDWVTSLSLFTFMHWRRKWQPTPVFLPGESQGWRSLVGCHLWGRTESDTTEATQQQQHQDVFHSKLQKAWINVAQNTYYLLQKSLVRSQFLGVNLVPHHVVWSPLFPPFSLHTLLSSMYPQSLSECSSSFSTSCSTSRTGKKKKMDSFLFCVSSNQRGTHFLDALKKMSLEFYWPELCHMPMTNLVTGKG